MIINKIKGGGGNMVKKWMAGDGLVSVFCFFVVIFIHARLSVGDMYL